MNEIDRLKHEEQALMDESELYTEDYVETLKIEEAETYERPSYLPVQRENETESTSKKANWLPFVAVIAFIWAMSAGVFGSGSFFALLLLFIAYKNWGDAKEDRQHRGMTTQGRKSLRGAMFALMFAFMFMFNAWGAFFPLLLISWGISSLLANRWQSDPVYY